ncbi:hypothetical protein [Listeria monocytogenes]
MNCSFFTIASRRFLIFLASYFG